MVFKGGGGGRCGQFFFRWWEGVLTVGVTNVLSCLMIFSDGGGGGGGGGDSLRDLQDGSCLSLSIGCFLCGLAWYEGRGASSLLLLVLWVLSLFLFLPDRRG